MLIFKEENQVKFISLASGSSGNCYYISNGSVSLLIDMGIGVRTLKKRLAELNCTPNVRHNIWGVFYGKN